MVFLYEFPMGNYGIGVPINVRCEGTIVLYHRNSIRGNTVGVFHIFSYKRPLSLQRLLLGYSQVVRQRTLTP